MRLPRYRADRRPEPRSGTPITQYGVGQRVVRLERLDDGSTQWVCKCERDANSASGVQGPWCKHVAKASAIRSIERLTGERVISHQLI